MAKEFRNYKALVCFAGESQAKYFYSPKCKSLEELIKYQQRHYNKLKRWIIKNGDKIRLAKIYDNSTGIELTHFVNGIEL